MNATPTVDRRPSRRFFALRRLWLPVLLPVLALLVPLVWRSAFEQPVRLEYCFQVGPVEVSPGSPVQITQVLNTARANLLAQGRYCGLFRGPASVQGTATAPPTGRLRLYNRAGTDRWYIHEPALDLSGGGWEASGVRTGFDATAVVIAEVDAATDAEHSRLASQGDWGPVAAPTRILASVPLQVER